MRGYGPLGRIAAACLLVTLPLHASSSRAANVETLLMPGKVTKAHEKQEENCANCHDRSNVRTQTRLCLDCHKDVDGDIRDRKDFHGKMPNAGAGECRACHTEHKGRKADIVQLNRSQFDHALTEFPLEGAHAALECDGCHKPGAAWRKAPPACAGCHKADDVHRGQFTQSCADCHGSLTWAGGKFDHDKTDFQLTGAHQAATCDACHVAGRYKQSPKTCNGCHATDDEHRGARGPECAKCHTTKEWKTAKYDHLKETGYALKGMHDRISCAACHSTNNYKDRIPKDCNGCHKADDVHTTRFGVKCDDCHDNERWPLKEYDHTGRHHFPLVDAHAKIDCYACHTAEIATQKLAKDCAGCHRSEDPHGGKLKGACDSCHGQRAWRSDILFDHDLSKYPLLGLHRLVSCAQCHATQAFDSSPLSCIECHSREDVHKGGLGKKCESCHSANGWPLWAFDHAKQAHFALLGAHAKLKCADCHHEPPGSAKTSSVCASCHHKDDRHLGEYGAQCDRCHNVHSWKGASIQ